ncbi:alpha/beta fold hydrolase [Nocardiopsis oceani]
MQDTRIELRGREVAYTDIGDPDGTPVLFFHGAPMSRWNLVDQDERFAEAGLRVVSPDRPGYGGSAPAPGRVLTDWAADTEALADALGFDRFLVGAHSSGGPYGVVVAASLPDRVIGTVLVAGVTDFAWPRAWDGFVEHEAALMRLPDEKAALEHGVRAFGPDGSRMREVDGGSRWPEPDRELFAHQYVPWLASASKEAFRQGVGGYTQDAWVQGRPWDFDLDGVAAPVLAVHGADDTVVPLAHSRHTTDLVPGAELRVLPGHGHVTVLWELPGLLTELRNRP